MTWLEQFLTTLGATTIWIAILAFLGRVSFQRFMDVQAARFGHKLALDKSKRDLTVQSEMDFKERQMAEFYGPIYALLKRGRPIYDLWAAGKLRDVEGQLRDIFTQANDRIAEIILTKSHLIRGGTIPKSFTDFLTHVAIWHAYLGIGLEGVPLSKAEFPEAYSSDAFEREIIATTEELKQELEAIYRTFGWAAENS